MHVVILGTSTTNYHTYSFPVSHQSRHRSHRQSYTARGCRCSGCCHSGNGTESRTGFPLWMNRNTKCQENLTANSTHSLTNSVSLMLFWAGQLGKNLICAGWVGVLTAEVKLLIWIISTVIVSVAFPVRLDAYVVLALKQEGGAICAVGKAGRWKSETFCQTQFSNHVVFTYGKTLFLWDNNCHQRVNRENHSLQDTYDRTSHLYSPDSRGCHRIWSVQRYSVHWRTGSNRGDKSATLQHKT